MAALLLLAGACGHSAPSESEILEIAGAHLKEFGEPLEVRKTDGQHRELLGTKLYLGFVRGAAKLDDGFYVIQHITGRRSIRRARPEPIAMERGAPLPAGTIYVMQGEVVFSQTEKGWKYDSFNPTRWGYCPAAKNARECYDEFKWDS